jgi:hypothetical protein
MDEFNAPVYHSILYPPLVMGIPNKAFFVLMISVLAIIGSLGQVWFIVPILLIYILLKRITAADVFNYDIFQRLIKLPEVAD